MSSDFWDAYWAYFVDISALVYLMEKSGSCSMSKPVNLNFPNSGVPKGHVFAVFQVLLQTIGFLPRCHRPREFNSL